MKIVSNNIKNALKQPTTQRKGRILVNGSYYEVYNVEYYADAYNEGNVIGNAIASQLDFDLPYMDKFETFKYYDGVWTGAEYEYVDFGTFTVFDEQDEDEFNKHITAFDNLIKFNKQFEDVGGYPKTLYQELKNICSQAEVELQNASIPNGNFIVENNQFVEGENLKTVLKAIEQISGTYGIIKNDKLVLQLKNETNEIINKSHHEPIEWKRKTYGINQLILGMSQVDGEYVLREDLEDIEKNGVHRLVINDNYFAYTQDKRQKLIDELFNQVKGFGYIPYEMNGEWLNYVDIGDTINIDGNDTIILRINGKSPKSLESTISAPAIIDSSIEYVNNTNAIENRIKRAEIIVDKNSKQIDLVIENVKENSDKIEVYNPVLESEGNGQLSLPDCAGEDLLEFIVEGKSEQDGTPTPIAPVEIKNISGIENLFSIDDTTTPTKIVDGEVTITTTAYDPTKFLIKVSKNQPYTLSFINDNASSTYPIRLQVKESDSSGNAGTKIADDTISYTSKHVRTITPITEYIIIEMFRGVASSKTTIINEIQLEKGATMHSFVPYGSNYLVEKVVGKNKLDINNMTFHEKAATTYQISENIITITNTSDNMNSYARWFAFNTQDLKGKTLTLSAKAKTSGNNVACIQILYCDDNGTNRKSIGYTTSTKDGKISLTFTVLNELLETQTKILLLFYGSYGVANVNGTYAEYSEIQIEENTTATEYEEYKEAISLIDLKNNLHELSSIGDVKDELIVKDGLGVIDKSIWEVTLDNSFTISSMSTVNGKRRFKIVLTDLAKTMADNVVNKVLSNKFIAVSGDDTYLEKNGISVIGDTVVIYYDAINTYTDDEFKIWLSNNPIILQYELETPKTINLGEVSIKTVQSDCTLTLEEELNTDMYAKYVKNNPYNEIYPTKIETLTQIQLSEDRITESVSKTYATTDELAIERSERIQTASQINQTVSTKVGENEVVSVINQSAEQITLTGNRVVIESDNFNLDADGTIEATGGTVGGFSMNNEEFYTNIYAPYDFTVEDRTKVRKYLQGEITLTDAEKAKYDIDGDGIINTRDYLAITNFLVHNITTDTPATLKINSKDIWEIMSLRNGNDEEVFRLGLFGITATNIVDSYDSGRETFETAANSTVSYEVYFATSFSTAPSVTISQVTAYPNNSKKISVGNITNEKFEIFVYNTSNENITICWTAIGSD